jgi:hypothetical protein
MARYQFKCTNPECDKHDQQFSAQLPMNDIGKVELYPKCESCGELTEKIFIGNTNFQLKGMRWCNTPGGYSGGLDVSGNPVTHLIGGDKFRG